MSTPDERKDKIEDLVVETSDFWKKHGEKVLTTAVIVLALKNRGLKRENLKLITRLEVQRGLFDQLINGKVQ